MKTFLLAITLLVSSAWTYAETISYFHGSAIGIGAKRKATFMVLTKVRHLPTGVIHEVVHYSMKTNEGFRLTITLKKKGDKWIIHSDAVRNEDSDFAATFKGTPDMPKDLSARAPNPKNPDFTTLMNINIKGNDLETELMSVSKKGQITGKVTTHQPAITKAEYDKILAKVKITK